MYVITFYLEVTPLADSILPPVSSKLLKFILESRSSVLGEIASRRQAYKPLLVSMLYRGGVPLFSNGSKPLTVRAGEQLGSRISLVSNSISVVDEAGGLEGRYETPYGAFELRIVEALVEKLDSMSLAGSSGKPTGLLYLRARSPVILTSKTIVSSDPDIARRIPRLYRLIPSPGLIAAYSFRLWNRVVGLDSGMAFIWRDGWNLDASMIARAAEVYMAEVDYRVEPVTVVIGRDESGRLRKARGWIGWVLYKVKGKRLAKLLDKTLALATRIGLGKSRGIGLGDIEAAWRKPKD